MQQFRDRPVTMASHLLDAYVAHQLRVGTSSLYETLQERYRQEFERDAEGLYAHVSLLHGFGRYLWKTTRML
ncbi:MAG: hypothetical protein U0176_08970 [Bacteroidia bacterium]